MENKLIAEVTLTKKRPESLLGRIKYEINEVKNEILGVYCETQATKNTIKNKISKKVKK